MKITIVQGPFLPVPPICGGAVEKLWFQLGKCFVDSGHSVLHLSKSHPDLAQKEVIDGVFHFRIPGFNMPANAWLLKVYDFIYSCRVLRHLPPADILITNTFWLPFLRRWFNKKSGLVVVSLERMPRGQLFLYKQASCLRCCSTAVYERALREAPGLARKLIVIPNPLPFVPYSDTRVVKQKTILYCGRLHPEKGIDLLLRAYNLACDSGLMAGWTLRIVGPHDTHHGGGGSKWYKTLRASSSMTPNQVHWVGPVFDQSALHSEYLSAAIFVYPTLAEEGEASPVAPLEAMSFGSVPIVSSLPCFYDFIEHERSGLFFDHRSSDSVNQLASAFIRLADDVDLLASISASSSQVANAFHPRRVSSMMLNHFSDLLGLTSQGKKYDYQ